MESRHHCGWSRINLHPKPHLSDILYWFVSEKFMIKPSVNWKHWRNQCNEQSTSEATYWQWEHIKDSFQRKDGNYWNFTVFRDIVVLCHDGVLDLLYWMLHYVCNPWAKPNCQLLTTENVLLKFFAFVKRFSASLVRDRLLAQFFCWEYFYFVGPCWQALSVEFWTNHTNQLKKKKSVLYPWSLF